MTLVHAEDRLAELTERADRAGFDPTRYASNWRLQLGTLGSETTSSRAKGTRSR